MKFLKITILTVVSAIIFCGCEGARDIARRLAGRPTSSEVERMAVELNSSKEVQLEAAAQPPVSPSSAPGEDEILARINTMGFRVMSIRLFAAKPEHRYCIVAGAFENLRNADRLVGMFAADGFEAFRKKSENGLNVVLVCPADDAVVIMNALDKLSGKTFLPKDAWVLKTEK